MPNQADTHAWILNYYTASKVFVFFRAYFPSGCTTVARSNDTKNVSLTKEGSLIWENKFGSTRPASIHQIKRPMCNHASRKSQILAERTTEVLPEHDDDVMVQGGLLGWLYAGVSNWNPVLSMSLEQCSHASLFMSVVILLMQSLLSV